MRLTSVPLLLILATSLSHAPRAYAQHSTTGPIPPPGLDAGLRAPHRSQVTIPDVPAYIWHHGCGPTAAGMVIGYWDGHGFPDLVPGSADSQTEAVNAMIADDSGHPNCALPDGDHYQDYSCPIDNVGPIQPDKSETGGAHASNCVGDFMRTSWSVDGMRYGWSWNSNVPTAFEDYVNHISGYFPSAQTQSFSQFSWSMYMTEIDAGRPMVLLVDTDGNGDTDHFVTAIGYDSSTSEYGVYHTWDTSIHWYDWSEMESGNPWGISKITTFAITSVALPDLTVIDIDHTPDNPTSDDETKVRALVRNQGPILVSPAYVLFSIDSSPACTLEIEIIFPEDESWTDWCILGSVPWGDHPVEACADPDNVIEEGDETNNCLTEELHVLEGGLFFLPSVAEIVLPEGDFASFGVRLSEPPSETLTASVESTGPDPDIQVTEGAVLTFTQDDWNEDHTVTLYATPDADHEHGRSTILIQREGGPCLPDTTVLAIEQDSEVVICFVAANGSGDYETIEEAINAGCDEIELGDGVFTGPGNRDIDYGGRAITVRSQSGDPAVCEIDCAGAPGSPHRGFVFRSGETNDAVLEGLTIRNGYLEGSYPEGWGGGILCDGASPTIRNCVLSDNRVSGDGSHGGGMVCRASSATLIECEFTGNAALSGGIGGLAITNGSNVSVRGCEFTDNTAETGDCGGLGITGSWADVDSCRIIDNAADIEKGGGIWCHSSIVTFDHCTVARSTGHGLLCENGSYPILVNCTFCGDSTTAGGAIHLRDSEAMVYCTIIAFSAVGEALTCGDGGSAGLSCCNIYGNKGGDWVGCIEGSEGVNGNISENPLFCDAEIGNLTLAENSPCLPGNHPDGANCGLIGAFGEGCGPVVGVEGLSVSLTSLHLTRTVPNPFGRSTQMRYVIPTASEGSLVSLRIYDPAGRLVRTLVNTRVRGGAHEVSWDGKSDAGVPVAGGVYFCQLKVNGETQSRRMILVR